MNLTILKCKRTGIKVTGMTSATTYEESITEMKQRLLDSSNHFEATVLRIKEPIRLPNPERM